MDQALKARKEKRLDEADQKCRRAIKVLGSAGWVPQGETQWLGIILFEKGKKQEGLKLMKSAFGSLGHSHEREIVMARAALEMRDYQTVIDLVDLYRSPKSSPGGMAKTTKPYWPKGNSPKALEAILNLAEASRLLNGNRVEDMPQVIELLRKADQSWPRNIGFSYALGSTLYDAKDYAGSAPHLRFVALNAEGVIRRSSRQRYNRIHNKVGGERIEDTDPPRQRTPVRSDPPPSGV